MATHPAQLLTTLLLGLFVVAALLGAAYLIYRAFKPRVIVVPHRSQHPAADDALVGAVAARERRRKAVLIGSAAAIALASLFGKYLVAAFYPAGEVRQVSDVGKAVTVKGASGSELQTVRRGNGGGPTLVFTHGWGADRGDWEYAVRQLPLELNVVLWDLPGLGASTAIGDYAIANLAAELDRVVTSIGSAPVILVGHSVGGIINIEYARRYPHRMGREIVGVVQANTTYTNPLATKKNADRSLALQKPVFEPLLQVVTWTSPIARVFGWLAYRSGLAHLQLAAQSFAGNETWNQLDHMASYAYRSSPNVVARGALAMLQWDGTDALGKITVPTLVIAGAQDTTTLPSASDRMARRDTVLSTPHHRRRRAPGPCGAVGPLRRRHRVVRTASVRGSNEGNSAAMKN